MNILPGKEKDLKTYLFEYEYEGEKYYFDMQLKVDNIEEVIRRLDAIRDTVILTEGIHPKSHQSL